MSDTPRSTEDLAKALENEIIGTGLHLSLGQFQIVEEASARLREQEQREQRAREALERARQRLSCRNGYGHYCPNCDNSYSPDLLAELDAALGRP